MPISLFKQSLIRYISNNIFRSLSIFPEFFDSFIIKFIFITNFVVMKDKKLNFWWCKILIPSATNKLCICNLYVKINLFVLFANFQSKTRTSWLPWLSSCYFWQVWYYKRFQKLVVILFKHLWKIFNFQKLHQSRANIPPWLSKVFSQNEKLSPTI